jgi:hypothetical protein
MTKTPKDLRRPAPNLLDQRQQQIDPARKLHADPDERSDRNRKQPGGSDPAKARRDARKASAPPPEEPGST